MSETYDPDREDVVDYGKGDYAGSRSEDHDEQGGWSYGYEESTTASEPTGDPHGDYQYEAYPRRQRGGGRPSGGGGRSGTHVRRPARRSRGHHPVLVAIAVIVALLVVAAAGFAYWVKKQVNPGGKLGPVVTVVIPAGASSTKIGSVLDTDGIIHSGKLFPYYVRIKGSGTLYPGTYHLAKNESYSRVISSLQQGPPLVTDKLVVPEGFTIAQMAVAVAKLPHAGITARQFLAAADGGQVRSPYEPPGSNNLEGLLFPATYTVPANEDAVALVQQMVQAFNQNATAVNLTAGAAKLKMTPYQVVIVASMVEREASRAQDRGPIASVIYNRLSQNMPLGIDSTLLYGLGTTNPDVNPDTPSPYNTRINKGLPPTPIAGPGVASLSAAISPPTTSYLYYAVTGPGGQTSFASTAAGFATIEAQCEAGGYCS
jgi:UPF0755 protein